MKLHSIKIVDPYFADVLNGRKKFELRRNDRDYKVGDTLRLQQFSNGQITGRECFAQVVYLIDNQPGLELGYCIMGINSLGDPNEQEMSLFG